MTKQKDITKGQFKCAVNIVLLHLRSSQKSQLRFKTAVSLRYAAERIKKSENSEDLSKVK